MTTETKPDHEIAREELEALFKETVKHEIHITGPVPLVKDDWPCMHYYVNIAGQTFDWSTGVGHAMMERFKDREESVAYKFYMTSEEVRGLWQINCGRTLKDRQLTATIACKVGRDIKISAAEVIASCCGDALEARNASCFEVWASEVGYEADSRKAEAIYMQCKALMPKLRAIWLTPSQIKQFAELSARL